MIPWFQYTTLHLGPIPIQVWGFFVALGMIVSIIILYKRAKNYKLNPEQVIDIALWMIIFGIIFARIFHIIFYEPAFYFQNLVEIFKIWHGGSSSFGGLFGAVIGFFGYIKVKKLKKKDIIKISDLLAFSALFGWMIGRLGCFMIHDHLGRLSNSFLAIQHPDGSRLDMALLEIIFLLPFAIVFMVLSKKFKKSNLLIFQSSSLLFVYYGILRFILDFFRVGDIRYYSLTPAQYFSIVLVVTGMWLYKKWRVRIVA